MSDFSYDSSAWEEANYLSFSNGMRGIGEQILAYNAMQGAYNTHVANITAAGELSAQGSLLEAQGYREQKAGLAPILQFNLATDKLNTQRLLDAKGRQTHRLIGTQTAQVAQAGVAVGSKSALMLRNEAMNDLGVFNLNTRTDAENSKKALTYEYNLRTSALDAQIKSREYQADLSRKQAQMQISEAYNNQYIKNIQMNSQINSNYNSLLSNYNSTLSS